MDWLDPSIEVVGRLEKNVGLGGFSTFRIGGTADYMLHPASSHDLSAIIRAADKAGIPWMVLGLGSNVLFDDAGFRGLIIHPGKEMGTLEQDPADPAQWRAGAGVPTPIAARRTASAGWSGLHHLVGVPGAVGGGIAMNAGAHGADFASVTRTVDLVDRNGESRTVDAREIGWAYRNSNMGDVVVTGATFELKHIPVEHLQEEIRSHIRWRKEGTPFDQPCCGSVFKNPPDSPGDEAGPMTAGRLIERVGMKGTRIGGAEVSRMHANYIVNVADASSSDVLRLIEAVRSRVLEEFGLFLELEVKVIPVEKAT